MRDILYSLNQRIPDQYYSRQFIAEKSSSSLRTRKSGMEICQEIIKKDDELRSMEK
jgi:hypothetical protein